MSAVSFVAYRGLLAEPGLRRLAGADACARLPQGMVSITVLLVAAEHASMAVAGLVVAGYTLGQAVTGPVRGRLADRHGLSPVAACCGAGYALALLALLAGAMTAAPAGLLIAAAAAAGLMNPPLSPGMRSLWSARAGAGLAQAAFALDAAVFDLAYITGPVLAGALATGLAPAAALGLMLTGALANAALTATEVALTGYARQHHTLWAAGPLLAGVSAGSILGSLLLGALTSAGRLPQLLACYAGGLALLTAAGLDAPLLAVAAPLAGLFLGPVLATLFGSAAAAAPSGSGTETQAWLNSIMNGGAAAGAARAGAVLSGAGASRSILALALACALALGAAASAAIGGSHDSGGTRRARSVEMKLKRRSGVSSWTPRRVLDAASAMEWCPDGAIEVLTDDYRLIRYPDWALDPAFPAAAQVTRSRSARTAAEVIGEVAERVRGWNRPGMAWWVSSATLPPDTEAELRAAGGTQVDAVQILARELNGDEPVLAVPGDVSVELVDDERTFLAASMVVVRGWGRKEPTSAALARGYAEAVRDLAAWSSFRVLASVRGEPASVGGCTLRGEAAQGKEVAQGKTALLWGAVTLREYRRRGAYRAVLAERLRLARAHGATLALVKGRVETSGPILLRAGFADYGEERCYWLPLT